MKKNVTKGSSVQCSGLIPKDLQLFKIIVESSSAAVAVSKPDGTVTYVNPAHERLFGRPLKEAKRLDYKDYYPPDSLELLESVVVPALVRDTCWAGEMDVLDAEGRRFSVTKQIHAIHDDDGHMLCCIGFMRDNAERKQLEEELAENQRTLRILAEFDRFLAGEGSKKETLRGSLAFLRNLENCNTVSIALACSDSDEFALFELRENTSELRKRRFLPHGASVLLQAVEEGEPLYRPDYGKERAKSAKGGGGLLLFGDGIRSVFIVPLVDVNGVAGTLNIGASNGDAIPIETRQVITLLASRLAQALTNFRLYESLFASEDILKKQQRDIAETNTALNVLLKKMERDKIEFQEQIMCNVKEMIEPYLEKLRYSPLNENQKNCLEILEENLREITSPFASAVSFTSPKLTPTELKVANLVRHGRSIKEVAEIMNLSPQTVKHHRKNIRKKLGIAKTKGNLQSFLANFAG